MCTGMRRTAGKCWHVGLITAAAVVSYTRRTRTKTRPVRNSINSEGRAYKASALSGKLLIVNGSWGTQNYFLQRCNGCLSRPCSSE